MWGAGGRSRNDKPQVSKTCLKKETLNYQLIENDFNPHVRDTGTKMTLAALWVSDKASPVYNSVKGTSHERIIGLSQLQIVGLCMKNEGSGIWNERSTKFYIFRISTISIPFIALLPKVCGNASYSIFRHVGLWNYNSPFTPPKWTPSVTILPP